MKSLGNRHNQHSFAQIPNVNMARSKFDRSFAAKDTFNFDELVPIFVDRVVPGDTVNLNISSFCRLAPQIRPMMDNMYVDFFCFWGPDRILWENFEKFMGQQDNPGDSTDYLIPQVIHDDGGFIVGSMADHFGIPTEQDGISVNALPFRLYNLIYNYWFRDQNLINSLDVPLDDGPDSYTIYQLRKRAKKHDYFTSCLPSPQKGPAVPLPLGNSAPVVRTSNADFAVLYNSGTNILASASALTANAGDAALYGTAGLSLDPNGGLYTDLSEATGNTINLFRQAIMIQSMLELDMRGGTRYPEVVRSHFNVVVPDFRVQWPEFLSAGTTRIAQHPIAQTSNSTESSPQGNLAAFSTQATSGSIGFNKSFVEHGWVMVLAQARADVTYQQGLNKKWSTRTKHEQFWPKLQELGEQAVLTQEIWYGSIPVANQTVFGYQERYADMRYHPSEVRGQFRTSFTESLDQWHLAQFFETEPVLNGQFIESNTPIERVLVVPDDFYPDLLADFWFDYKHARPLMTYGVPASLGRF